MKNHIVLFLVMTIVTGLLGFSGFNYYGIEVVRVLFLIFADLLVVATISKLFFPNDEVQLERVKK
jgi:uncharacterized membrane protein YtjA (UPF0391 family)